VNGVERVMVEADAVRLEVGDRAVIALVIGNDGAFQTNAQAIYLLNNGEVEDTERAHDAPLVAELEAMTEAELLATLRQAQAAAGS
jgi:hypothetical protein